MRMDSSMFDKQINPIKTDLPNSPKTCQDKEDVVKEIENKEENVSFPGEKKLIEAIEKNEKDLLGPNTSLKFSINEKTKDIVVKIIDDKTKEVIKEIPPEKIINMIAEMCERAGIFVDKRG